MKYAILALAVALTIAPSLLPTEAVAKSVKWRCVARDPAKPSAQYCTPSTSRP